MHCEVLILIKQNKIKPLTILFLCSSRVMSWLKILPLKQWKFITKIVCRWFSDFKYIRHFCFDYCNYLREVILKQICQNYIFFYTISFHQNQSWNSMEVQRTNYIKLDVEGYYCDPCCFAEVFVIFIWVLTSHGKENVYQRSPCQ